MNEAKTMINNALNGLSLSGTTTTCGNFTSGAGAGITNASFITSPLTVWDYWQGYYYPQVIRESYPVYIQERAQDKGHKAYEIIKTMMDKKLIKLDKVSDFVSAMDCLIKIL